VEWLFLVIPLVILFAVVTRLAAGGMDRDRIREYVEKSGGEVVESQWAPFGPGWFGEKSDRIYDVRYVDKDGNEHEASCKTSLLTGVYFTEDRIVSQAEQLASNAVEQVNELEAENRRLREELEQLRGQQGNA
jgi:hypothetical protein